MKASVAEENRTGDTFVMNMMSRSDGSVSVRSIELIDDVKRLRFSFNKDHRPHDIFTRDALESLLPVIDKAREQKGLILLPDLRICLPELILEGCRIMVTAGETGSENIMIRWKGYYGRIVAAFRSDFSFSDCIAEDATSHALVVMRDLYMPLYDISQFIDEMIEHDIEPNVFNLRLALKDLNWRIKKLRYYELMVKNFLAGSEDRTSSKTLISAFDHDNSLDGDLKLESEDAPGKLMLSHIAS